MNVGVSYDIRRYVEITHGILILVFEVLQTAKCTISPLGLSCVFFSGLAMTSAEQEGVRSSESISRYTDTHLKARPWKRGGGKLLSFGEDLFSRAGGGSTANVVLECRMWYVFFFPEKMLTSIGFVPGLPWRCWKQCLTWFLRTHFLTESGSSWKKEDTQI